MTGLLYLKYTFNVSDENLPRLWVENPYWQYFCGFSYMQHKLPVDYTTPIIALQVMVLYHERFVDLFQRSISIAYRQCQLRLHNSSSLKAEQQNLNCY